MKGAIKHWCERRFCIKNAQGLYWNNTYGWGDVAGMEVFSLAEKERLNLPMEGVWHEISQDRSA